MASELPPIDPSLRIGAVHLAVSDIARSADFYEHVLGLPLISREPEMALLGGDPARPALVLIGLARPTPVPVRSTGLFHVAWLHPSRPALAATIRRLAASPSELASRSSRSRGRVSIFTPSPSGSNCHRSRGRST